MINPTKLRRQLRPLLKNQTEDAVDWIVLMMEAPDPVRKAVKALCESYRNAS